MVTMEEAREFPGFPDLGKLTLAPPLPQKKAIGARICPLTIAGQPIHINLGSLEQPLRLPFEISCFDKDPQNTRLNINMELLDPDSRAWFDELDNQILELLTSRAGEFWKKSPTPDQIRMQFKPTITTSDTYPPMLKGKIEVGENAKRVHVWNSQGEEIDIPCEFRNRRVVVRLGVGHLFITSSMCGLTLQVEHLMLSAHENTPVFPFQVKQLQVQEAARHVEQTYKCDNIVQVLT